MADDADTFDYIIVGAGSAGCVLANRLSEDRDVRVCLLEAGPRDTHPMIKVPIGIAALMNHKKLNWRFWTTQQKDVADRSIYIPRGRALGGSSSINGMVYMRGHRLDYDDWADAGNKGWSYREVLPYFMKSENNESFDGSPYHATGGPMNVKHHAKYSPLAEMLFQSAESFQFPRTEDFNGASQEGFGLRQSTIRDGRRESTATAFLHPARERRNLTIVPNALADRVLVEDGRTTGVEVRVDGATRRLAARREVILSGGTVASPLLLMRSGIGPAATLRKHGIEIVRDLPAVGENLQDHISVAVQHLSPTTVPYGLSLRTAPWLAWSVVEYLLFKRGFLTNTALHAGGYFRSRPDIDRPDLQYILMPVNRSPGQWIPIGHGYGLITVLLRPKSRGHVTLTGADPAAAPEIEPRFFSEPEDLDLVLNGVKLSRRLLATEHWDAVRGPEILPGEDVQSDEGLKDFIRANCQTVFHPVGTCRMGPDKDAVVDPQLRVNRVAGLRVVDASIMPTLVGGNTNAPTIMIGEKGADMIRGRPPLPAAEGV